MNQTNEVLDNMQKKPHCDIDTGKIYGCSEGTKDFYHEEGHIKFNEFQSTSSLKMWQGVAFMFWMIAITLCFFNKYMLYVAVPMLIVHVGIDVYEEYWCNRYAKLKLESENGKKPQA